MKDMIVDPRAGTITLSSAFEKKAFTPGTDEYKRLMSVRADFPECRLETRQFKTNTKQDRHRGLTYKFMREYISSHEKDPKPVLEVLEDQICTSKGHSLSRRYPTIKSWFLERYPSYAMFGMTEEELAKWQEKQDAKAQANASKSDNITRLPSADVEAEPLPNAVNA